MEKMQNVPGLSLNDFELFTTNFNDLWLSYNKQRFEFPDFPKEIYNILYDEMTSDVRIPIRLANKGFVDTLEKVKRCAICRHGTNNNTADFNKNTGKFELEYFACGYHGNCPYDLEGIMCLPLTLQNGEKITPSELTYIKLLTLDLADKEIADKMNCATNTAKIHRRNITKKLSCYGVKSKVGIARFASENGIRILNKNNNQKKEVSTKNPLLKHFVHPGSNAPGY